MIFMGIGTMLYELERNDMISVILLSIMLLGIFGLIIINESNLIHFSLLDWYLLLFYFL